VVAINKMDVVGWDKVRFDEIKRVFMDYLMDLGFDKNCVTFVPISAFLGINLSKKMNEE
jgi:elongation factor 1 alpha-like protein